MQDLYHTQYERLNQESLTDDEVDILYDIIQITHDILTKNNIKYILEGGSLLGAVRCGGLIPYDNDADFDILDDDLDKIRALSGEFDKYNLEIIETPGWGLQISYKNSPTLKPNMWSNYDNTKSWSSKWPFLDLISIKYDTDSNKYILAGHIAKIDYPNYFLYKDDWDNIGLIKFGHLDLFTIANVCNRKNYLDRHYPEWESVSEMVMDHRKNIYFDKPIRCPLTDLNKIYRKRSDKKSLILQ